MDFYELKIAGLTRKLPLIKINKKFSIASFVILGDAEIVNVTAPILAEKLKNVDILVTAEAKGIPLTYEISKILNLKNYIVARKSIKSYMKNTISVDVNSITTASSQKLFLNDEDIEKIKGKNVALIDDVISTGKSLEALEKLVEKAGGKVIEKTAILAEGDAAKRNDIIFIEKLPIFENK